MTEIIHRVVNEEKPPFRPKLPDKCQRDNIHKMWDQGLQDLMAMCWDEYPLLRLSFTTICHTLKKMRQEYGT